MGREEPGISLYCRKVLIKDKCKELLPDYLRFVKGVVDCEDLPLNISRENYQDSQLISKVRNVLTRRIIKALTDEMTKDPEGFTSWAKEFALFISEGIYGDKDNAELMMKLLRFTSSNGGNISIDDYIASMKKDQQNIYFTVAGQGKQIADSSAYMEPFLKSKTPVLYLNTPMDEILFVQMNTYKGHKLVRNRVTLGERRVELRGHCEGHQRQRV